MRFLFFIIFSMLPGIINCQTTNPFLKGIAELQKAEYAISAEAFTAAIAEDIKTGKSYLNRGIAFYKIEEFGKAESDLRTARTLGVSSADLWIAKIQARNNNPKLCVEYLEKYFNNQNTQSANHILKGPEFKDIHYSNEWQNIVSKEWGTPKDKIIDDVNYYLMTNELAKGFQIINNAMPEYGEDPDLLSARAKLYIAGNNPSLAIIDLSKANELSQTADNLAAIADAYMMNNNYSKAIERFKEALTLSPESFELYYKLADANLLNDDPEKAKEFINTFLLYFEEDTAANYLSAKIHFELKEYQSSLKKLNGLMAEYPIKAEWFFTRGLCYMETGMNKYAAADLSMCLDLEPFHPKANFNLGQVQMKMGNTSLACYYWERAQRAGEMQAIEQIIKNCKLLK